MRSENNNPTVLIKRCETYDRKAITQIVLEGMDQLEIKPQGKLFAKPNVVFAHEPEKFGTAAYTPSVFLEAGLSALAKNNELEKITVGENSAVGFPTRLCYKHAGYVPAMDRLRMKVNCPVDLICMDEAPRKSVFLGGKIHDNLRLSKPLADADTIVYFPKLKCHCVSNMTGAVKLNIGICCDDDRSIRHDFLLNQKIADLLFVGYPDFIVMDAINVGVGNEAFPELRQMGLILMGTNPLAIDLVASRLLGYTLSDVPYLEETVARGFEPCNVDHVKITGDLKSIEDLDAAAKKLLPYDDAFYQWQDVSKELERLHTPIRFFWGPYQNSQEKCLTGCVMGIKMFLAAMEKFAGAEAFVTAKPVVFVIGRIDEKIDAKGEEVFLIGSCAKAEINNAKKIIHIDKCFTTAGDMNLAIGKRLGVPSPMAAPRFLLPLLGNMGAASLIKFFNGRYLQDMSAFMTKKLIRRI